MVAVSDDGDIQALVCTDPAVSSDRLCLSCQQVCRALNAALERCDFRRAARLKPECFELDPENQPNLKVALEALNEAMVAAIFEFESMAPVSYEGLPTTGRFDKLIGVYS